jgi:hypothetical protein
MAKLDVNMTGQIDYSEFVGILFQREIQAAKSEM